MTHGQYKFHIYLNASHAIYINGKLGQAHPHTWEISLATIKLQDEFVQFTEVERTLEKYLERYQNQYLNEIEPFNIQNPTLENITVFLLDQIQSLLNDLGWMVFTIEVAETPTRSYIISLVDNNVSEMAKSQADINEVLKRAFKN